MNHYESLYKHLGRKYWSVLSLLPVSLIAPKFILNGREIRMHLNFLLLADSGHAKSQTAREFEKISFNVISTKNMSVPRLYHEVKKRNGDKMTLVVEDVAIWFMDEEKIKFLEGMTGEEESYNRENMRNIKDKDKHLDLISFCSGTSENITNRRLKEGILRRFFTMIIVLSKEEHDEIIDFIMSGSNKKLRINDSEQIVKFYQELKKIQDGTHPTIQPIEGYIFPGKERMIKLSDSIKSMTDYLHRKFNHSSATEVEEVFRLAISYAFLNIHNKHKNGLIRDNKLVITEEDLNVAENLIRQEIYAKKIIYSCIYSIDILGFRTMSKLREWENKRREKGKSEIPKEAKFIYSRNIKK